MEPFKIDNTRYHLEDVNDFGILMELILSSQGDVGKDSPKEDASIFEFENLIDVMYKLDTNTMTRDVISEESLHLLSAPEN